MHKRIFLFFLALGLVACAAQGETNYRRSSAVLTAEEIGEVIALTAYEAVRLTRPQWLRTRSSPTLGNPNPSSPVVYLDGVRVGKIDELERLRADVVEQMEYLSPTDATNRFGTNHEGGVILVTTR